MPRGLCKDLQTYQNHDQTRYIFTFTFGRYIHLYRGWIESPNRRERASLGDGLLRCMTGAQMSANALLNIPLQNSHRHAHIFQAARSNQVQVCCG